MVTELKRLLVGQPLENAAQQHQRLSKRIALAVFSSDALSSVAYATEAILLVLVMAGAAALTLSIPISLGIGILLFIVGYSYRQTIFAYPNGGGAYVVAHENLGKYPGLIAASALIIDYVLTAAVSTSAGVAAISSLATTWGYPEVTDHRVAIALVCLTLLTLVNLRGVKESGSFFAIPTYIFVVCMLGLISVGLWKAMANGGATIPATDLIEPTRTVGIFLILQAFSAGCTAMTGVEAISNAVPYFQKNESRNAAFTLMVMVILLGLMFLGISSLAHFYGAAPHPHGEETLVSQIARQVVGTGTLYFIIQVATAIILLLAANTSFNGFPPLASLLSRDRYLPRQFASRGDRLVFSNAIIALGICAGILIVIFNAREQAMLPLYAIGVFISFTLSQSGMVKHWLKTREPHWQTNTFINGLGATLTCIVFCVIIATRFAGGGWVVLVIIPILVAILSGIHNHYDDIAKQLSLQNLPYVEPVRRHTALVLLSGVHRGVIPALQFATSLAPDNVTALYVNLDDQATTKMQEKWERWGSDVPLVVLNSPYRSLIRPILAYVDEVDAKYDDDVLSVIVPEFVPSKWWQHLLHNQTALVLKTALLFRKNVVVISVPYHLGRRNRYDPSYSEFERR